MASESSAEDQAKLSANVEVLEDHSTRSEGSPGQVSLEDVSLGAWVSSEKDSRDYNLADYAPEPEEAASGATMMFHEPGAALNQAKTDGCVGHDARGFELGHPNPAKREAHDDRPATLTDSPANPAIDLYFESQKADQWAGGEYPGASPRYGGSSLHGLMKYMAAAKLTSSAGPYAWAQNPADLRAWLRGAGGVMFASRWTQGMFTPNAQGFVTPTGKVVGGHAYYLFGTDENDNVYAINSWGAGFGKRMKFTNADGSSFVVDGGVFVLSPNTQQKLFDLQNAEGVSPVKAGAKSPDPGAPNDHLKQLRQAKRRIVKRIQTRTHANQADRLRLDKVNAQIKEITG